MSDPQPERPGAGAARRLPTEDPLRFTIPSDELPPGFGSGTDGSPPALPLPAATVVLLRDSDAGPEALLLRRHGRSGFAAGMWVYPGGRVDSADHVVPGPESWSGPAPAEWAHRLGVATAPEAAAYLLSAVREAWEETGIPLLDLPGHAEPARIRADLLEHRTGLPEVLAAGGRLRADRIRYLAHWITPEAEPRRFDTRFFLAAAPDGAAADPHRAEITETAWVRPSDALERFRRGELRMLPPTVETLRTLGAFRTVAEAMDDLRGRPVRTILPRMYRNDEGVVIEILPGPEGES